MNRAEALELHEQLTSLCTVGSEENLGGPDRISEILSRFEQDSDLDADLGIKVAVVRGLLGIWLSRHSRDAWGNDLSSIRVSIGAAVERMGAAIKSRFRDPVEN